MRRALSDIIKLNTAFMADAAKDWCIETSFCLGWHATTMCRSVMASWGVKVIDAMQKAIKTSAPPMRSLCQLLNHELARKYPTHVCDFNIILLKSSFLVQAQQILLRLLSRLVTLALRNPASFGVLPSMMSHVTTVLNFTLAQSSCPHNRKRTSTRLAQCLSAL